MQREIKFRAWDKHKKIMRDVECIGSMHNKSLVYDNRNGREWAMSDFIILMQYTGLHDKNGKEIYEGDTLKSKLEYGFGDDVVGTVEYNPSIAAYVAKITDSDERIYHYALLNEGDVDRKPILKYTEVIGNIYENPELLKEEPNGRID